MSGTPQPSSPWRLRLLFGGALLLGFALTSPALAQRDNRLAAPTTAQDTQVRGSSRSTSVLVDLSTDLGDLTAETLESVVSISVRVPAPQQAIPFPFGFPFGPPQQQRGQGQQRFTEGQGSGVVVSVDGLILTNNHVIREAAEVTVVLSNGDRRTAQVVGTDPATDLAVLRLSDPPQRLRPIRFADSDSVRPGELALAVGNPFGLSGSATLGMISAVGRSQMGITDYENFIQTDAAINPGNSGGALVNVHGELIGINTAIYSRSGGYQGIGFAIPSNMARRIMQELVETGNVARGWLGVGIAGVPPKIRREQNVPEGAALIAQVEPSSPAASAGLQVGDIVLSIDGEQVTGVDALRYRIAELGPGHQARFEIQRGTERRRLEATLGQRPNVAQRR